MNTDSVSGISVASVSQYFITFSVINVRRKKCCCFN